MQKFKKHSEEYLIALVMMIGVFAIVYLAQSGLVEAKKGEGIVYEPYSGVIDHCVTDASGVTNRSLYDILQTIGTSKKATVKFKNDNESGATTAYKVVSASGGDFSAYSNVYFEFEPGAMLESGVTLSGVTLPSPANVSAQPNQQIMSGTSLYFGKTGDLPVMWHGVKADGSTNDSTAMQNAVNSKAGNLILPSGSIVLSSSVALANNTYIKGSKLTEIDMSVAGAFAFNISGCENVTIDGITFDGSGVGSAGSGIEKNITIKNCTFKNVLASNTIPYSTAVAVTSQGIQDSNIHNNTFESVYSAVGLLNANNVSIVDNSGTTTDMNFISITNTLTAGQEVGYNINISRNKGIGIGRMGVELYKGPFRGTLVDSNQLILYAQDTAGYGISFAVNEIVSGTTEASEAYPSIIRNNIISGTSTVQPYGIEAACGKLRIEGNTIKGFEHGISTMGTDDMQIVGNKIIDPYSTGIYFSNVDNTYRTKVKDNYIENAKTGGIYVGNILVDYAEISSNVIMREAGKWSGDNTRTYYGINLDTFPFTPVSPLKVTDNTIIQTALNPGGFNFYGIGISSNCSGDEYSGNLVKSLSSGATGTALFLGWTTNLENTKVTNNTFINLAKIVDGTWGFTTLNTYTSNNRQSSCTLSDANLINSFQILSGTTIYPRDMSSGVSTAIWISGSKLYLTDVSGVTGISISSGGIRAFDSSGTTKITN